MQTGWRDTAWKTHGGANDTRFKQVELSLGYRMLQRAGIIESPFSDAAKYEQFRGAYESYRNGTVKSRADFNLRLRELRDGVIKLADVVVCTPIGTSEAPIKDNAHPSVIAVDEAPKLLESELWPVFAYYKPQGFVLIGDHHQLRPLVFTSPQTNPFHGYHSMSLFTRQMANGHPSTRLLEQYRMLQPLESLVSTLFYDGALRTGKLDPSVTELAVQTQTITRHADAFGFAHPVMFIDAGKSSYCEKDARGRSSYNVVNCQTIYALVEWLVENGIAATEIAVLTMYRAQHKKLLDAVRPNAKLRQVTIETVDSFQGRESGIVILDLTATRNLHFIAGANRLCVALSRARSQMYIVNNWDRTKSCLRYDDRDEDPYDLRPRDDHFEALQRLCRIVQNRKLLAQVPKAFASRVERAKSNLGLYDSD